MFKWILFACLVACQGEIRLGAGAPSRETPRSPDDPHTEEQCALDLSVGWGPLRRVTHEEYDSSIKALLATTTARSSAFPTQGRVHGFTNGSALQTVGDLQAEGYFQAAQAFAAEAVKNVPALLNCDVASVGEAECGRRFVDRLTTRAFRRGLSPAERAAYQQLLADATTSLDFTSGLEVVIGAVLMSPHFLYHVERGVEVAPGIERLDGATMAARLATALWQALPDDELLAAAQGGDLDGAEGVEAQARRMMADPRARPVLIRMFSELTHANELSLVSKDETRFGNWELLRSSMTEETNRFVESVLFDGPGSPAALLTARHSFVNRDLAQHYGLPAASNWQRVSLAGTARLGLLTQGSALSATAKANQSSPVLRGVFVRENLLCETPPPPPQNADITPPDIKPGVTTRQRYAQHAEDPSCAGCHALMDPIGLGFEHFDAVGAWRSMDEGAPVDASGEIRGTDVSGPFVGVEALATRLATSPQVGRCVAKQAFRFFVARHERPADACSLARLQKQFPGTDFDLKNLIVVLTTTNSFRHRKTAP
jgi:Protein of unknown function (DUF1588)/Protein of unknown function (DUF1592)/Protein of unknown function (DUF1595)/Protein of unknown function (DUF1587)/Protein of unknown function (DUF1585)